MIKKIGITLLLLFVFTGSLLVGYMGFAYWKGEASNLDFMKKLSFSTDAFDSETTKTLKKLQKNNPDVKLWMEISDISLSEPLVQTTDNEYYLTHDAKKAENQDGALFIDYEVMLSKDGADNIIIYGHNNENHKAFSDIVKYTNEKFFTNSNPIVLTTEHGKQLVYEPILLAHIDIDQGNFFPYHTWINWSTEKNAAVYYEKLGAYAVMDKKVRVGDSTRLLTLSTCDNALNNARYILVARNVKG